MAALSEEQELIRDAARAWTRDRAPVAALRALRDAAAGDGVDRALWAELVELGWTGILVGEAEGGTDLGHLTFALVLEELGRHLAPVPLFASAYVGASALRLAGDGEQRARWLPEIVAGREILALAVDEGPRHRPHAIATSAAARELSLIHI